MAELDDDKPGFVKLHRKIINWEWYKNTNVFVLFIHCLILANHKPKRWEGRIIDRGEFVTSFAKLSEGCGLSVHQVRTALNKLKSTSEVTSKATNTFTMIKVNNYSTYHDFEKSSGKGNGKEGGKRMANEWQTSGKRVATTKNVKNVKNIKKEKKEKKEKELVFPECVEKKLIEDYFSNRIEIKKPMTHIAKELFLKKVERLHLKGEDVTALIEMTIMRNYTDIYEQKGKSNGKENNRTSKREPVEKAKTKSGNDRSGLPTVITIED